MTESAVGPRPSDRLLAWLSARGRASRPTIERACRVIAERFDPRVQGASSSSYRYGDPLRRAGHVEAVPGGLAVVPTTLCWTRRSGYGVIFGARDGFLLGELRLHLGPGFTESHPSPPWPATWGVAGGRETIAAAIAELGLTAIDEPGMRLLTSLPTLEAAIDAWPGIRRPSDATAWEVAADLGLGHWRPTDGEVVWEGLVRSLGRRRRTWMIVRGGDGRILDSPERRAVAWWAELARQGRYRFLYRRAREQLQLPASLLPPPAMVERPLIWASGGPPRVDFLKHRTYEAVDPQRAGEVARILGLRMEEQS